MSNTSKEKARRDKSKNKNNRKIMNKEKFYEEEPEDILTNGYYENAFQKKNEVKHNFINDVISDSVKNEVIEINSDKPTENEDILEEEFNDDYFKQEIVK